MRHLSRAHRVALDWLFGRINLEAKIQIKCVDTKNQLADMLTKGTFTRDEWNHLLHLFNISHFLMFSWSHFLSNRKQSAMSELRQGSSKKDLRSRYHGQRVWCQETSSAQCKPLPEIRVLHTAPGIKSWVGILFSLAHGNLRGTGSRTQRRILKSGKKMIIRFLAQGNVCGVVCVSVQ